MPATSPGHPPIVTLPPSLSGDQWTETLNDGSKVVVRPIRPDDRELESDFIARLSPEARHFRFLGEIREASPALLDMLVNVDKQRSMAFVAIADENGKPREVGVSRFSATDDMQCECAVTTADDWQHRGLAVTLMRHLIDVARHNGFKRMYSIDAGSNEAMKELARYLGFRCKTDPGDATQVVHTLDL